MLSIGAVLDVLRAEFPEVTISKIRFLEAERLVEPQRTPSGYRKFTGEDVERLAQVLRLQRDHYLPLRVIREHLDALPPGSALLVVRRGPNSGSRFLLDTEVTTAGRHPESDIFLDDITVSRRHVEFRRNPAGFTVADVGSLNGTYVNRERIDEVPLSTGDEVQIGKYRVVFFESRRGY